MGIQINGQTDTVTATDGSINVGGDVTIPGILTYEDVTNVDSVGVITARDGLNVTGGRVLIGTTTEGEQGADDLTIATNSTTGMTIRSGTSNAGNIYFSDGVSGSAEYRGYISYMHNEDSFAIGADGNEKVRITSDGKMGLGISSPARGGLHIHKASTAELHLTDDTTGSGSGDGFTLFSTSSSAGVWYRENAPLRFATYNTERVRISSGGNVGINDSGPDFHLDVNGNIAIREGQVITWHDGSGNKAGDMYMDSSDNFVIRNTSSVAERMRLRGSGPHLLIGTGGDATYNEITESSSNAGLVIGSSSMGNGGIVIRNSTSGTGRIYFADNSGSDPGRQRGQINYYHNGDYMMFATAGSERLRITSGGIVDVTGKLRIDISNGGTAGSGTAEGIFLRNTQETDNNAVTIFGGADDYNAAASAINFINVDHSANAGDISFDTRSTSNSYAERLRITSGGNIGINCNSPGSLLELNAAAGTKMGISLGAVGDNITASRYIGICKTADQTDLGANSGFSGIEFGGPSSTNEGYIAFHTHDLGVESGERIRLTKDGKFGVGLTAPESKVQIRNTTTHGKDTYATANTGGSQTPPTGTFKWDNVTPVAGHGRGYEAWVQSGDAYPNASNYIDVLIRNAGFYRITLKRSHSSAEAAVCQMMVYGLANSSNSNYPVVHMNGASGSGTNHSTVQRGGGRGSSNAVASFYWEIHSYNVNTHDTIIRITTTGSNNQGIVALIEEI